MGQEVRGGSFFSSHAEVAQLAIRVMTKTYHPSKSDAAYLFAHTPANMWPVILKGSDLYRKNCVGKLVILGLAKKIMRRGDDGKLVPDYGTPAMTDSHTTEESPTEIHTGWRFWKDRLCGCGAKGGDVIISELADPVYVGRAYNTHTEAVGFVQMAKARGWHDLTVVSPYWHIIRATAEVVTAVLNHHPKAMVFVEPCDICSDDWLGEGTLQSQSDTKPKARMDSLVDEVAKMDACYRQGDTDLRSAREILEYFNWRDRECGVRYKAELARACMD